MNLLKIVFRLVMAICLRKVFMLRKIKRLVFNAIHPVIGEVWLLHHVWNNISEDESLRQYEITPEDLETKIQYYLSRGQEFVSVDEVYNGGIAVTLDDGYEDNYLYAAPIFLKYNIPFCIFVTTDYVFNKEVRYEQNGMTPEQLLELSKNKLCTIGGHTASHANLKTLSFNNQTQEITKSIAILEKWIGKKIKDFAAPYGEYNEDTLEILKRVGISSNFAGWGGPIRMNHIDKNSIPRILFPHKI